MLLLLLAAIPLQSIAFFFGGVAETEVILSFVILAATALLFSTIGILFLGALEAHPVRQRADLCDRHVYHVRPPDSSWGRRAAVRFSFDDVQSSDTEVALLYFPAGS